MESFRSSSISPKCTSHLGIGLGIVQAGFRFRPIRNNCPIKKFLESGDVWTYIDYEDARVFLRKSARRIDADPDVRACLDLSSIRRESRSDNTDYDPNAT